MRRRRALAALLLVVAVLAAAGPALAADAAPPPPPGMDASPPAAGGPAAAPAEDPSSSMDALEKLLLSRPAAAFALAAFRIGLFLTSVLLVVLTLLQLPPRPPPASPWPPVVPLPLPYAMVLVLGVYLLVEVTGRALVELVPAAAGSGTALGMLAMALPTTAASVLVLWLRRLARAKEGRAAPRAGASLAAGLWTFFLGSAAALLAALAGKLLLDWAGRPAVPQQAVLDAVTGPPWQAWLIAGYGAVLAPFTEEVLFRGLLHPAARAFVGRAGATVGVALLFALVHQNAHAFLPLFVLALLLGWLIERTDSVLATFTVHALFNATNLVPILLFRYA